MSHYKSNDSDCKPDLLSKNLKFIRWKKEEYLAETNDRYFNDQVLQTKKIHIRNGIFHDYKREKFGDICGKYILKKNGCLYFQPVDPLTHGPLTHTVLSSGNRVLGAGYLMIIDGKLQCFTNGSGHYKTTEEEYVEVINYFNSQGIYVPSKCKSGHIDYCGKDSFLYYQESKK